MKKPRISAGSKWQGKIVWRCLGEHPESAKVGRTKPVQGLGITPAEAYENWLNFYKD